MYKQDLALNNLQGLICHKFQPTNQQTSTAILPATASNVFVGQHKLTGILWVCHADVL